MNSIGFGGADGDWLFSETGQSFLSKNADAGGVSSCSFAIANNLGPQGGESATGILSGLAGTALVTPVLAPWKLRTGVLS